MLSREQDVPSLRALLPRGISRNASRALMNADINANYGPNVSTHCHISQLSPRVPDTHSLFSEAIRLSTRTSTGRVSLSSSPQADKSRRDDPRYATEYIKDIMDALFRSEQRLMKDASYMTQQPELSEKMRMILVDWLVEVHQKFKCRHETLFLAVDIVDRYLSVARTARSSLQLVGVTAMLLAAKYEEIWPPEVKDCVYISANTYTREEVLRMERAICSSLQFRFTLPNAYHFLSRLLEVSDADLTTRHLASFYAETAMLNYVMLKYKPSQVAAACVYLANLAQNVMEPWNSNTQYYARYRLMDVMECGRQILDFAHTISTSKYTAVKRKYSSPRHLDVSNIPLPHAAI